MNDDWKSFWQIKEKWSRGALRVTSDSLDRESALAIALGVYEGKEPIALKRAEGRNLVDLIGSEFGILHLISERTANVLEKHKVTGYRLYATSVQGSVTAPWQNSTLFALGITGRTGVAQWSQASVVPAVIGGQIREDAYD